MISSNVNAFEETPEQEEAEPQPRSSSKLVIWLVVVSFGVLFLPLFLLYNTIKEETLPLVDELAAIEATLAYTPAPDPETEALRESLLAARGQVQTLEGLQAQLLAQHIDWPATMAMIGRHDPTQIILNTIVQGERRITVSGYAVDESAIINYGNTLRDSPLVDDVIIQTIDLQAAPTPDPNSAQPPIGSASAEFTIVIVLEGPAHE